MEQSTKTFEKKYHNDTTEVCGNCHGTGLYWVLDYESPHNGDIQGHNDVCPLCYGAGIIDIKRETTVSIYPKKTAACLVLSKQ
jgi:DnaJ-class molecular chaperone